MPDTGSHSQSPRNHWRLWLAASTGLTLLAVVVLVKLDNATPPQWFDPTQSAPHAFHDPANLARFQRSLQQVNPTLDLHKPVFIRFTQRDCPCERLVDAYHQLMVPLLTKEGFQVLTLNEADLTQLAGGGLPLIRQWVPSTPAVMVLNGTRGLAYFGPYHQEGVCNSKNSFLEPVLTAVKTGQPVNIVNTLVQGCFCHFPASVAAPQ